MSWWTTDEYVAPVTRQGGSGVVSAPPWWSLRRLFERERGDCDVLVLSVPLDDGTASPYNHRVQLCDSTQGPTDLIGLVKEAVIRDPRALWRDPVTEARFWTVWYHLMAGTPLEDPVRWARDIGVLQKQVAEASAYAEELLHLCDPSISKRNSESIARLDRALSDNSKDEIKTYGYVCLKLWGCWEDRFSKWLRCQFVLKALRRARDPNYARVLRSHAQFRLPQGRLADLVAHLNATGWSAVIKNHYDKALSIPNPLRSTARSASSATALEIWYDHPEARWWLSTLYKGVEAKQDGIYQVVAVKVITMPNDPPGQRDRSSLQDAWFRDDYVRKILPGTTDKNKVVFPTFGVFNMRLDRIISVSPWARHGNIKQYVLRQVKDTQSSDWRVHEIILDLVEQLLPAVKAVHDSNLVHGNLKGNNVLITDNAVLQLADFGSYDVPSAPDCATNRSSIPWHKRMVEKSGMFMSPELLKKGIPSAESDMWAVSCVVLEVYLAAFTPEGHVFERSDRLKPHPRIPRDIWNLISANWVSEPSRRLSAEVMHRRLDQVRDRMQAGFSN